ncbi:hypothetical protein CHELA1G2_10442 [Hyphomicrobiales bacterium]|nr:hypothetical protein CHELA1G2_10442 [Hyphomicrobiales bacterium]
MRHGTAFRPLFYLSLEVDRRAVSLMLSSRAARSAGYCTGIANYGPNGLHRPPLSTI